MGKVRVRAIGRIRIRVTVTVGVIDGVYVVRCEKVLSKSIGVGIVNGNVNVDLYSAET